MPDRRCVYIPYIYFQSTMELTIHDLLLTTHQAFRPIGGIMKTFLEWQWNRLLGVMLMSAPIVAAGCATESNPLNSDATDVGFNAMPLVTDGTGEFELDDDITAALNDPDVDLIDLTCDILTKRYRRTKTIRAKKRTVIVVLDRGIQYIMKFPKGALKKDTVVDIEVNDNNRAAIGLKFEPHGTKFDKPVKIIIRAKLPKGAKIDPDDLGLFYNDEEDADESDGDGRWEPQRAEVKIKGRRLKAVGKIDQFLQYGLGGYGPIQKWYYQTYYYP